MPHIGDRLDAKNVSWKWYSGGYDDAMAGHPDTRFQFHHQPLQYFQNLAPGTPAQKAHLQDYKDFVHDIEQNTLPKWCSGVNRSIHPASWLYEHRWRQPSGRASDGFATQRGVGDMLILITWTERLAPGTGTMCRPPRNGSERGRFRLIPRQVTVPIHGGRSAATSTRTVRFRIQSSPIRLRRESSIGGSPRRYAATPGFL
jgi:hypothetical protein